MLMPKPTSAAKPSIADAMWPSLSREAKVKEAQQAKAREEQKLRTRRLVDHLQETIDAVRRERGR
jgi:hypothetical protein